MMMKVPEITQRDRKAKVLDSFTEEGANSLAKIIEAKWRSCGHMNVHAHAVRIKTELPHKRAKAHSHDMPASLWAVRSNLINGMPST